MAYIQCFSCARSADRKDHKVELSFISYFLSATNSNSSQDILHACVLLTFLHLCENVKGRLVTSNQRLYGNAHAHSPGVLKRTQNKETWGKRTCCLCTFYQSDRSGWWISHSISSQKNICLKPLWLNIWIWESNFVRLFVLIAINAAARKLSWQFHFWWNIDVQGQIWAKI